MLTKDFMFYFNADESIEHFVLHGALRFIGLVDVRYVPWNSLYSFCLMAVKIFINFICFLCVSSADTYILHHELLNFMLVAMSTQLLSGPSPGPEDAHPFTDAAMVQVKRTKYCTMLNLTVFSITFLLI